MSSELGKYGSTSVVQTSNVGFTSKVSDYLVVHTGPGDRYEALVGECEEAGWKAKHFPVEVGCRGCIATSITK